VEAGAAARPLRTRIEIGIIAACGALAAVPIQLRNPDFARSALDWAMLFGLALGVPLLAAGCGAAALRVLLPGPGTRHRALRFWWRAWAGLALATLALLTAWAVGQKRPAPPSRQVVVVAIDGAEWRIIDALRENGRLPTFDALVQEGARGTLQLVSPVLSPPIWTSIASGVRPKRHGVVDFWTSSLQVRAKRVWEIADEHGLVSGALGYLVTWPPEKHGGFLVPGWLAQDTRTVPPELAFLIEFRRAVAEGESAWVAVLGKSTLQALRHGLTLATARAIVRGALDEARGGDSRRLDVARRELALALETDVFCHLLRAMQPHLAIFYHHHVDAAGHLYFKYYQPSRFPDVTPEEVSALGDALPRLYEATDAALARIRRCAAPDATLLVVSDHGQRAARHRGQPMLRIKTRRLLGELGIASGLRATNSANELFLRPASAAAEFEPALELLRGVVALPDGEPVFRIQRRAEGGAILVVGITWDAERRVRVGDRELELREIIDNSGRLSGTHTARALLLLAGPDIARGARLPRGSVLDVAPTVLGLLGLPIARDLDGRFLDQAIRPAARTRLAPRFVDTYGPRRSLAEADAGAGDLDAETRDHLEKLGYLE
jgi:predicted AlkP superfamily phosphohydrolase/phosphomutase